MGSAWNFSGIIDEDESCSDTVVGYVRLSVGLGWFFVFGGSMALGASVCCTFCDSRDYGGDNNRNNPATPPSPFGAENPQPTATSSVAETYKSSSTADPCMPPPSAPPAAFDSSNNNNNNTSRTTDDDQKEEDTSGTTSDGAIRRLVVLLQNRMVANS